MKLGVRTAFVLIFLLGWVPALLFRTAPGPLASSATVPPGFWPDEWQADSAFYGAWARADAPVALGAAGRSWLWGPVPFAVADEPYAESPTGTRLVEYLDKARMEVNDPSTDRASPYFVTTGLLVTEMVQGRLQKGNTSFEQRQPADVPVAGDPGSPDAPTYASFVGHTARVAHSGGAVREHINRDGTVTTPQGLPDDAKLFGLTSYDDVTGHNVPAVFKTWMSQTGPVVDGGYLASGPVFDPLYVLGRPITEAYWADVLVGGKPTRVLVQLFERRALTYNPSNPPEWRVEMANVGRAYYAWRYGANPPAPAVSAEATRDTVVLRGWNWPAGQQVSITASAGSGSPEVALESALSNGQGGFSMSLPLHDPLHALLLSGAVQIRAQASGANTVVPLALSGPKGRATAEGVLTYVPAAVGNSPVSLLLRDRAGSELRLSVGTQVRVQYSESATATLGLLRAGYPISVDGEWQGGALVVGAIKLPSLSSTGAQMDYAVQPDGKTLRITGTGWPGETAVALSLSTLAAGEGQKLASPRADSRGNFLASFTLPSSLPGGSLWLSGTSSGRTGVLARIALPFDLPQVQVPTLVLGTGAGEQAGGVGTYCRQAACRQALGTGLPSEALAVRPGEVLSLHGDASAGTNAALVPSGLTAKLYAVSGGSPAGVVAPLGGALVFAPTGTAVPLQDIPAMELSLAMPGQLAHSSYVLLVSTTWPAAGTRATQVDYAFSFAVK